jgi:hypothetical protein
MADAIEAVMEALARNRQLAAKLLVRAQDLEAELARLAPDDPRREAATIELGAAKHDYQAALAELNELERLRGQAQTLEARSIVASVDRDPFERSAEQIALDNVREHAANLDAEVRLGEELGGAPAQAAPPPPPPSPEQADDAARREFEALRAKPKKTL